VNLASFCQTRGVAGKCEGPSGRDTIILLMNLASFCQTVGGGNTDAADFDVTGEFGFVLPKRERSRVSFGAGDTDGAAIDFAGEFGFVLPKRERGSRKLGGANWQGAIFLTTFGSALPKRSKMRVTPPAAQIL